MEIIQVVAVERFDEKDKAVYGGSGILLNNKYVIITSNILLGHQASETNAITFTIISKAPDGSYIVKTGTILTSLRCESIKSLNKIFLIDFTVDSLQKNNLNDLLSIFYVIKLEETGNLVEFKKELSQWWQIVRNEKIHKGDEILVRSVPFGTRQLIDSFSRGIVSNIVGDNSCLIVSDCPTVGGSEGSPVYKNHSPIGIVISSLTWWRGEWTGLTLILDIRPFLIELIDLEIVLCPQTDLKAKINSQLLAAIETSLLQICSSSSMGTAILLNKDKGYLITNSHVVEKSKQLMLHWKGHSIKAKLLYKTPESEVYDLAIVKCCSNFLIKHNLEAIKICNSSAILNQTVYAAGFSLFLKDTHCNPTLSRGSISSCNDFMLKTTCCINAGQSGGAILTENGQLLGVIVSNFKSNCNGVVFPRFNLAIPFKAIRSVLLEFFQTDDCRVLKQLSTREEKAISAWNFFESKL